VSIEIETPAKELDGTKWQEVIGRVANVRLAQATFEAE
jgi:hypothetical protein